MGQQIEDKMRRFAEQQTAKVDVVFSATVILELEVNSKLDGDQSRLLDAKNAFQLVYGMIASLRTTANEFYRTNRVELAVTLKIFNTVLSHIGSLLSQISVEFGMAEPG